MNEKSMKQLSDEYWQNNPTDPDYKITDEMERRGIEVIRSRYRIDDETIYFWEIEGKNRGKPLRAKLLSLGFAFVYTALSLMFFASVGFFVLWLVKLLSGYLLLIIASILTIWLIQRYIRNLVEKDPLFDNLTLEYHSLFFASVGVLGIIASDTIVSGNNFSGNTGSYLQWLYYYFDVFLSAITGGLFPEFILFSDIEPTASSARLANGFLKVIIIYGILQSIMIYLRQTFGFTRNLSPVSHFYKTHKQTLDKSGITFRRMATINMLPKRYRDLGELFCKAIDENFKPRPLSDKVRKEEKYQYYRQLLSPESTTLSQTDTVEITDKANVLPDP